VSRARLAGAVVLPDGGLPAPSAMVEPRPDGAPDPCGGDPSCWAGPGTTNSDGRFGMVAGSAASFSGAAGRYDVHVRQQGVARESAWGASGYSRRAGPVPVTLPAGESTVEMPPVALLPPVSPAGARCRRCAGLAGRRRPGRRAGPVRRQRLLPRRRAVRRAPAGRRLPRARPGATVRGVERGRRGAQRPGRRRLPQLSDVPDRPDRRGHPALAAAGRGAGVRSAAPLRLAAHHDPPAAGRDRARDAGLHTRVERCRPGGSPAAGRPRRPARRHEALPGLPARASSRAGHRECRPAAPDAAPPAAS
jgi:hypothetical protein